MNKQIVEVLEGIYSSNLLRRTIVPLFLSSPGQGKSSTIRQFAESKGKKMLKITLSQRMPNEVVGMLMPDAVSGKMIVMDSYELLALQDGDIIFVDEVFNGTLKQTLDAVLNLLEDRCLPSGTKLANVMIVAASNPQGMMHLTPQIKERFVMYNINFDHTEFAGYMNDKYGMPVEVASKLSTIVLKEKFDTIDKWNYNSGRSVEKAFTSYCLGVPTPYKDLLAPLLNFEIELPMALKEIKKKKGDKIQYVELVKEMLSDPIEKKKKY